MTNDDLVENTVCFVEPIWERRRFDLSRRKD